MSSVTPSTEIDATVGKRLTHPGKSLRHKRQALPARGQILAILDRIGIAIESEDAGRPFVEDGSRIAARAERAVDMGLAGGDGERMDDFLGEDGNVGGGRRGHGISPFSSSASAAIWRISGSSLSSARWGFHSSNVADMPTNKASVSIPARLRSLAGRMIRPLVS